MIANFSIFPVGKKSLSKDVVGALKLIEESRLPYVFGPMGTSVEGNWDEVMNLIKGCRDQMLESNDRIYLVITIDEKKGATDQITYKIKSVKEKLERSLEAGSKSNPA